MFTVLLVEDEPAAGRYLKNLLEKRCPDFRVVRIAADGREGLSAAGALSLDLVITDVRMPVMDGIALVKALKKSTPDIPVLIVSGFQEFDYVREALNTGVVDYILKPVNAAGLEAAISPLRERLTARRRRLDLARLEALVRGDIFPGEGEGVGKEYRLAAARTGGLVARFQSEREQPKAPGALGEISVLGGRDGAERLYLGPRSLTPDQFITLLLLAEKERGEQWTTLAVRRAPVSADALRGEVQALYRELDTSILPGRSVVRYDGAGGQAHPEPEPVYLDRLSHSLREGAYGDVRAVIQDLAAAWERRTTTLLDIEAQARTICGLVLHRAPRSRSDLTGELERILEERFHGCVSYGEACENLWSIVELLAGLTAADARRGKAPRFFHEIRAYIESSYSESITLGQLAKRFGISEPYLTKLFRRHEGKSFLEFLTFTRIEAAKRLLAECPCMGLREVADCVGFKDQFYFSRVFKSLVGVPPSEYR